MSDAIVEEQVARALAALEDDSPRYRETLQAMLERAATLEALEREPELARALLVELRKLRPLALWVRDHATVALQKKRDLSLDGAICRLAPGEQLPAPSGRECWLEVDAASAETTLRALPSGWGVIVTGDLSRVSFPELRRAAPLRALGAALDDVTSEGDEGSVLLGARLDVVVVRAGRAASFKPGARVLWAFSSADQLQLESAPIASSGALCDGASALSWALRMACLRSTAGTS